MRTLIFILSAAAILLFTTCEEESPARIGPNEAYPFVASIDRTGENNKAISEYSNNLYYLECLSDSLVFYSTSSEIILQSLLNPSNKFTIEASENEGAKAYYEGALIIFSNDRDICKVQNKSNIIVNITNTVDTFETYPIYLEEDTSLVYMSTIFNNMYVNAIIKHNLNSGKKAILYGSKTVDLIPLYTTNDRKRLIFFETNLYDWDRGYFRSLLLSDPSSIQLLGSASRKGAIYSSISDDNKIVHTSYERTILFDINNLTEKIIGGYHPNHSCISKDGKYVISALGWCLCLYDAEGEPLNGLLEVITGERYFHKVAISPSSNKIVYIQSKSPEFY